MSDHAERWYVQAVSYCIITVYILGLYIYILGLYRGLWKMQPQHIPEYNSCASRLLDIGKSLKT